MSVLYLTIEKYVTKTRKPNNTKYFYKTMEFTDHLEPHDNEHHDNEHHPHQEQPEDHQQEQQEQQEEHNHYACDGCQHVGELQSCPDCEHMLHDHCLSRHQQESCQNRDAYRSVSPLI